MELTISATKVEQRIMSLTHVCLCGLVLVHFFASVVAAPIREQSATTLKDGCVIDNCEELDPVFQQFDLIERIRYGYGMTNNNVTAFYWYRKSAGSGDSRAMHNVGIMLALGLGTEQDTSNASMWLQRAYEKGQMSSAIALGHMHRTGSGVTHSPVAAAEYYQAAADVGDVRAQHSLANLHMMGEGVLRSSVEAFVLYSLAARKGHLPSIAAKDRLEKLLSVEEIQMADWMIRSQLRHLRK